MSMVQGPVVAVVRARLCCKACGDSIELDTEYASTWMSAHRLPTVLEALALMPLGPTWIHVGKTFA